MFGTSLVQHRRATLKTLQIFRFEWILALLVSAESGRIREFGPCREFRLSD
jgi:hypothetical protein